MQTNRPGSQSNGSVFVSIRPGFWRLQAKQALTGYADALLAGSRVVNGSGAAYAADFTRVLEAIGRVGSATPDTLTASVLAAETRTQTQQLTDALAEVRKAVEAVRAQLQQGSAAPARIAA